MRTTQLGIASSQPTNNGPVRANPRGRPRRLTEDGQVLILMLRRGRVVHVPGRIRPTFTMSRSPPFLARPAFGPGHD